MSRDSIQIQFPHCFARACLEVVPRARAERVASRDRRRRELAGRLRAPHTTTTHRRIERQFVQTLQPSIGMATPVIWRARTSESDNTNSATSFGRTHLEKSASGMNFRFAGVSIVPGRITFAVNPASLFSRATVRTSIVRAVLKVT